MYYFDLLQIVFEMWINDVFKGDFIVVMVKELQCGLVVKVGLCFLVLVCGVGEVLVICLIDVEVEIVKCYYYKVEVKFRYNCFCYVD